MFSSRLFGTATVLAVAAATCAVAGCSNAPDHRDRSSRPPSSLAPRQMSVHVSGAGFVGVLPRLAPGTDRLDFDNDGTATHMAAIARLLDGRTASDLAEFMQTPAARRGLPTWMRLVGGVDEIAPGHRGGWAGTLDPGSYLLVSMSPDAHGRPEVMDGFSAPFGVTGGTPGPTTVQPGTATIALEAHGGLTMRALPPGTTRIDVVNHDNAARTVDITRIKPGRTFAQVMAEARHGHGVPSSLLQLGGTGVGPEGTAQIVIEPAQAGDEFVVFDIDHLAQGAISDVTVR